MRSTDLIQVVFLHNDNSEVLVFPLLGQGYTKDKDKDKDKGKGKEILFHMIVSSYPYFRDFVLCPSPPSTMINYQGKIYSLAGQLDFTLMTFQHSRLPVQIYSGLLNTEEGRRDLFMLAYE